MLSRTSRNLLRSQAPLRNLTQTAPRRAISTAAPSQKSRSWKSSAARWGLAIGGVYWYNTSNVFAEVPHAAQLRLPETESENELLPTVDELAAKRRQQREASRSRLSTTNDSAATSGGLQISPPEPASTTSFVAPPSGAEALPTDAISSSAEAAVETPDDLEEEAESQGAFNEETGEINWDCPCLGGMAHGPCGPEFREAFSCFVYSKEEPKGVDCIERFKGMQECFRKHPDVYGAELSDDDEDEEDMDVHTPAASTSPPSTSHGEKHAYTRPEDPTDENDAAEKTSRAKAATKQVADDHEATSESAHIVPKAAFDATEAPVDGQNKQDPKKGGW